MQEYQHSIAEVFELSGPGLHTGRGCTIRVVPASSGSGIQFRRVDLTGQPNIPALVTQIHSTDRSTNIGSGNNRVHTVEHLMSAFVAARIDNVLVEVDGPEIPILDGSAEPFYSKIVPLRQDAQREVMILTEALHYQNDRGNRISAYPSDKFELDCTIDFGTPPVGRQQITLDNLEDFATEIARSRTFCFLDEIELLFDHGLIKGGDISNAVVFVREKMPSSEVQRIAHKIGKPDLSVRNSGTLSNTELRFPDEPVRHKLLDLLGDLYLLGQPVRARIVAERPGHAVNAAFTKLLYEQCQRQKK